MNGLLSSLLFAGITDLFDIPLTWWALLQEEGLQLEEQQLWRLRLCSMHLTTNLMVGVFFCQIMFYSFLWRSFLILHGHGFIRNGQLNLKLFKQLFWLTTVSHLLLAVNTQQAMYLKGTFPQDSYRGKVCLLYPIKNGPKGQKPNKRYGLFFIWGFVAIAYVFYLSSRCHRLMKAMCPGKKMSCIGRYKRNVLSYRETCAWSIAWSFNSMLSPVITRLLKNMEISPRAVIMIDTFYYEFSYQVVTLIIVFILSKRDLPVHSQPPKITHFYVHRPPKLLEPRRPPFPVSCLPQTSHSLHPVPIPKITQVTAKGKGKGKNKSNYQLKNRMKTQYHQGPDPLGQCSLPVVDLF